MLTSFNIGLLTLLASCITITAASNFDWKACLSKCSDQETEDRKTQDFFASSSRKKICDLNCEDQSAEQQRIKNWGQGFQNKRNLADIRETVLADIRKTIKLVKSNVAKLDTTTPAPDYTVQEILPISSVSISGVGLLLSLVFVIATCRRLKRQQTGSYRLHLYKKPAEQETTFSV